MFHALVEAGESIKADRSVRAVVLSGAGRGFCAGLDLDSFQQMAGASTPDATAGGDIGRREEGRITNLAQQACYVWTEMPAVVIAAVHGPAVGAGIQLALATDIRIVAPDAKLSVLEIRWGLVPDMTAFTGRMVSGTEAVELGLATRAAEDPHAAAMELATEIAGKNPNAIKGVKALLNMAGHVSLGEAFKIETATMASLIGSPNNIEAVTAYFEKREPTFSDRDQ
jgi:enoyl-CoA hydratase/carnithine racemase